MTEEEGQKQRLDVRTVDIGIRHDDNLAVSQLFDIKFVADSRTERKNYGYNLCGAVNSFKTRLFDIENLTSHGKHRLELTLSAVLCGTACRVTFHKEQLRHIGVLFTAIGELAGQRRRFEKTSPSLVSSPDSFSSALRMLYFLP